MSAALIEYVEKPSWLLSEGLSLCVITFLTVPRAGTFLEVGFVHLEWLFGWFCCALGSGCAASVGVKDECTRQ